MRSIFLGFCCATAATLAACRQGAEPATTSVAHSEEMAHTVADGERAVLPARVSPKSDTEPNFGIDLSKLTPHEAAIVESAWADYRRVLAGKHPDCPATSGFSDGGTLIFDCGVYEIIRYKTLLPAPKRGKIQYGPALDFLNGHQIERLREISYEEMRRLESDR